MTQSTVSAKSAGQEISVTELFSQYRFDARAVSARTDTPDLLAVFSDEVSVLERGYQESAAEDHALAEADMAVGFESLPE